MNHPKRFLQLVIALLFVAVLISCVPTTVVTESPAPVPSPTEAASPSPSPALTLPTTMGDVIPKPVSVVPGDGIFRLSAGISIAVQPATEEVRAVGQYLADHLNPATGYNLQVVPVTGAPASSIFLMLNRTRFLRGNEFVSSVPAGGISLMLNRTRLQGNGFVSAAGGIFLMLNTQPDAELGEEGYELKIEPERITLTANQPAGLFYGVQTLRQLFPASIESSTVQPGPWEIRTGVIRDYPRFAWRGTMLDVARHFFSVKDVTRYIDLLAYYKINRLHLHLSDDQGWRIEIKSWPNLTLYGGSLEVGGTAGGYYSQADYTYIVNYARSRYIMIVPEIDMPGHVNAALASYPALNCDGRTPELYTGIEVGFSSLCIGSEDVNRFVEDVIRELAALTPGPYIHIGGDEAQATPEAKYVQFIEQVQDIVAAQGKQMIGWEEIAQARLRPGSLVQHWHPDDGFARQAVQQGMKIIMSPANKAYMDMKYTSQTTLGLEWAGHITVQTAYEWDPARIISSGVSEKDILGVEAPLWSETLLTLDDIEYMAFPRLPGYAEIGWSPQSGRAWEEYQLRLAAHGPRLQALGVNYYPSPEIRWP